MIFKIWTALVLGTKKYLFAALLALFAALFIPCFVNISTFSNLCLSHSSASLWRFVYDYQSLLTGISAVVAALLALLPMHRQLALERLQSAIMTRDVLVKRLEETEARRRRAKSDLEKIMGLEREIYVGAPDEIRAINPHWAFDSEHIVRDVMHNLRRYRDSRVDPASVNRALENVILAANDIVNCLDSISAPARMPWEDPELGFTIDAMSVIEEKAYADAEKAEEELLPASLSAFRKTSNDVDAAYISVVEKLRTRVRDLDDFILSEDL